MQQRELLIPSTLDGSLQPSLFYKASVPGRPLLVGLHTWGFDRFNQVGNMLPYAEKYDFNLLLPEFRGPNKAINPNCTQACGSDLAKQDIKDAIDHVIREEGADRENVFLLGASGGGHMSLLMAGMCPEYFKAIGAFVPITDLVRWAEQSEKYRGHIFDCCGTEEEMKKRSPITYLDTIAKANLKIFHGKYDGVVPVSQSLTFYDAMMEAHPTSRVFLDIFDGRHELVMEQAMYWILSQYQGREDNLATG